MFLSLLAACVLVLCFAGVCFAIDPFEVNEGGFGPKIKGLQLGMKIPGSSLEDFIVWEVKREGFPVRFELHGNEFEHIIISDGKIENSKVKNITELIVGNSKRAKNQHLMPRCGVMSYEYNDYGANSVEESVKAPDESAFLKKSFRL